MATGGAADPARSSTGRGVAHATTTYTRVAFGFDREPDVRAGAGPRRRASARPVARPPRAVVGAAGPGYPNSTTRPCRSILAISLDLVAQRHRLRGRRPLPRLWRSRLQLRSPYSRLPVRRPSIGTSRPMGALKDTDDARAHLKSTSVGGAHSRQHSATTPTAPAIRWVFLAPFSIRIPSNSSSFRIGSSAFPVGIRPAHDLDGRPQTAGTGRHRPPAMVGIRRRPLGRQHAGGRPPV